MYWDPFEDMHEFQKRMNKTFESFFKGVNFKELNAGMTPLKNDFIDKGDYVRVKLDLPGVEKEDVVVTVRDDHIEVRAQTKHEVRVQKKGYYKHERSYGGFYRIIPLSSKVNHDSVKTNYNGEVLEIVLRKSKAKKVSKNVKVK
jgi:HSP20 family protein